MIKQLRMKTMLLLCALIISSVSSAWGERYVKVTSASDLVDGEDYILAETSQATKYIASTTYSNGKYTMISEGFTIDGNTIEVSANNVLVVRLGGTAGAYTFYDVNGKKYIGKSSSTAASFAKTDTPSNNDKWTIKDVNGEYAIYSNYKTTGSGAKDYTDRWWSINGTSMGTYTNTNSYKQVVLYKKSSTPVINASNVDYAADITSGSVAYTVTNPIGGKVLGASSSTDWISNIVVGVDEVSFDMEENVSSSPRVGSITLTYDGATSKVISVSQAAAVAKYVVTIETPSNGTLTLKRDGVSISSGDLIPEGTELDIEAVPALGYSLDKWEYSINGGSTWTDGVGTTYTVTSAVSLRASFSEIPQYTVTLSDKGEVLTELYGGEGVELPARKSVGDYTFVGWSETDVIIETTSTPTVIPSGKYSPTANKTLYPIYTRKEGSLNTLTVNIKDYATAHSWTTTNGDGQYSTVDMGGGVTVALASTGNNGKVYTSKDGIVTWRAYDSSITITSSTNIFSVKISNKLDDNYSLKYLETTLANDVACEVSGKTVSLSVLAKTFITDMEIVTGSTTTYYYSHPVTTATITINSACTDGEDMYYATYSNDKAFVVSDEIEVSEISIVDGKLYVEAYKTGDVVPANTGVMVAALAGGSYTVDLSNEAGKSVLGSDNMLKASSVAMDGDNLFYRLTMHDGKYLGFYWGAENGAAFAIAANKAYLAVPVGASARIAGFNLFENEGEATAIEGVKTISTDAPVFNLNGQRVNSNAKGLLIKNGKKFMNR